ncbi:hypothetical protein HY500_02855 [Candidatus Woesearchaeota archaeon]|nr:hypothetical protein [Candidatus Woesearchaeota archaeon]
MAIPKKDVITPSNAIVIVREGPFDAELYYSTIKNWFDKRMYTFTERENTEKYRAHGNELNIKLDGDKKVDDFVEFHIETFALCREYKKKHANVKINIVAYLDLDYRNQWQDTPFKRLLFYLYINFLIKGKIKHYYETNLYLEMMELIGDMKRTLGMYD